MSQNHGNTPAAWTAVFVGLIAFVVGGLALMLSPVSWPMFWAGLALLPVALIVFVVMTKMGLGNAQH
jgi:hypothetical protein